MASISSSKLATVLPLVAGFNSSRLQHSPLLGWPMPARRGCSVKCSMEEKPVAQNKQLDMVSSMTAAVAAASCALAGPAAALVDERMSTEGTGLPFGLSNNLLGWILLGVFGLIWSLYTVYTSGLDEDDDSALSL